MPKGCAMGSSPIRKFEEVGPDDAVLRVCGAGHTLRSTWAGAFVQKCGTFWEDESECDVKFQAELTSSIPTPSATSAWSRVFDV
jgi:hypothetical protein